MQQDELFRTFHRYNRLVKRDLVPPLEHNCGGRYYTALDAEDNLILGCNMCNAELRPGTVMIERIESLVKRHFNE